MHPLAHRQRPLSQIVQNTTHGPVRLRRRIGPANLSQYLLLTDHRAVQTAGHREEVLHGGLAVADVGMFGELTH